MTLSARSTRRCPDLRFRLYKHRSWTASLLIRISLTSSKLVDKTKNEDGCTGRYWEGRFKSQALLDGKALAACVAYVDLNPVRAGLAETPEQPEYTSIKKRTHKLKQNTVDSERSNTPPGLLPFVGHPREDMPKGIPFRLKDYLQLVDWTGRAILENKCSCIPQHAPPILDRLQLDAKHWLSMTQHFESRFKGLVGASQALKAACKKLEFRRTPNLGAAVALLN